MKRSKISAKPGSLSPLSVDDLKKLKTPDWDEIFIQQDPLTASRVFDEEAIIVTSGDGMSHSINDTGTFIWVRALGKKPLGEIIAELCDEFDVDDEIALKDAAGFVLAGVENRFLRASHKPFPPLPFDD